MDEVAALQRRIHDLEQSNAALEERNTILAHRANQQRGRVSSLVQIIGALRMTRDRAAVLALTADHAAALIPGAECVLTWLVDGSGERLELWSVDSRPGPHVSVQAGQGMAGRAFVAPRAMKFSGPDLLDALAEYEPGTRNLLATMLGDAWPPHSAIGTPLRTEQGGLGALVLYGGAQSHLLMASDLSFVQALADLIALALADAVQEEQVQRLDEALHRSELLQADTQQRLNGVQAGLLQSAKLAAVGQLAASVAHEINNPLYAVRTSLFLVGQDLPPDAPQREFLDLAEQELGRIARIIARMRDFYRPTRSEFQPTDLNGLMTETLHLAATYLEHKKVEVIRRLAADLPTIDASPDQIRQVLINLVLNASDAMSEGGRLTVTSVAEPDAAVITIADNGIGIPPEVRDRLFEPFFTTKASGTGLGLSVSYHIIAQHGGSFEIDSEPGHGTTCTVRLPWRFVPRADAQLAAYAASRSDNGEY